MLGEPEYQFALTRAVLSTRGAQKQIPIILPMRLIAGVQVHDVTPTLLKPLNPNPNLRAPHE